MQRDPSVSDAILQILLYNQHYVYDDGNNDSVASITVTSVVTMKITYYYELYVAAYSVVTESAAIIMMTTAFHESPSAIHNVVIFAATDADAVTKTTTVASAVSQYHTSRMLKLILVLQNLLLFSRRQ